MLLNVAKCQGYNIKKGYYNHHGGGGGGGGRGGRGGEGGVLSITPTQIRVKPQIIFLYILYTAYYLQITNI